MEKEYIKNLTRVLLGTLLIFVFSNYAWSSVEGLWDVTGSVTVKISIKNHKLQKLHLPFDDQFIFHNNGIFEMTDLGGLWTQKARRFQVLLSTQNVASYFRDFIRDHYGLNVDVYVTKISFKGQEHVKKRDISGSINLQMDVVDLSDGEKGKLKARYRFRTPRGGSVASD
jgi:hypothetical protein